MNVCAAFLFRFTYSHSSVTVGKHGLAFNTAHHQLMQAEKAAQELLSMAVVINKRKDRYTLHTSQQYILIYSYTSSLFTRQYKHNMQIVIFRVRTLRGK